MGEGRLALCQDCHHHLPWNHHACQRCAEPLGLRHPKSAAAELCGRCVARPPALTSCHAPLLYHAEVARLVHRFKFHADCHAGHMLVALFAEHLLGDLTGDRPDVLLAVPADGVRARQRGLEHAEWLTCQLAGHLALPVMVARRRRGAGQAQRGLSRSARLRNLRGSFVIDGPLPAHVALVDDVMTTGATIEQLARCCKQAGARRVDAWVMARTPVC